jgi:hypothetical protein
LREETFVSLKTTSLMRDANAFDKELVFGIRDVDGSYSKLVWLEHQYFMAYVEGKLGQAKASWT